MASNARRSVSSDRSLTPAAALALVPVLACLLYLFWPSPVVELDDEGYDVTIALYRVCNQQSESGLDAIEEVVGARNSTSERQSPQRIAIASIIQDARGGRWNVATEACRKLLEDQVDR